MLKQLVATNVFAQQAHKCTLKGPMNESYVLVRARLLSMGPPNLICLGPQEC